MSVKYIKLLPLDWWSIRDQFHRKSSRARDGDEWHRIGSVRKGQAKVDISLIDNDSYDVHRCELVDVCKQGYWT